MGERTMEPVKSLTARDWTVADAYAHLPESGTRRYEVIDGELFVSPEASEHHQFRAFELATLLTAACPGNLRVSGGAINLDIGDRRHLEPDLAVKRLEDFAARWGTVRCWR
jgi:Uma2 family endonuclease